MKNAALIVACILAGSSLSVGANLPAGANLPTVYDGNDHGDPPFLIEDGWKPLLNGKDLSGWTYRDTRRDGTWMVTKGVIWPGASNPKTLIGRPEPGDRIVNTVKGTASDLICNEKMSDFELYIEFMIPANSNSGVFLHGLYEMQIWDSYGIVPKLDTDRTGALYHYEGGPINGQDGGTVPLVRAEHPHGQWNAYHVWFQGPRFDASGKKIQNAKFLRVLLNGQLIHENQERLGRTQASPNTPEAATNPVVMLQGDHGAVAFRNIYVHPLRPLPKP